MLERSQVYVFVTLRLLMSMDVRFVTHQNLM